MSLLSGVIGYNSVDNAEVRLDTRMDENLFREFYELTSKPLWRYLFQQCGNSELTNDIHQEAYIRFLKKADTSFEERQLKSFLYRIAGNLLKDHFRKVKREKQNIDRIEFDEHFLPADGLKVDMENTLSNLKPKEKEILWLAYVEGYSHEEIADITGQKPAGIRVSLFRAKNKLTDLLKQKGVIKGDSHE